MSSSRRASELTVRLRPSPGAARGLLVLLHGLGADEDDLLGLAPALPADLSYAAVRAPLGHDWGGYAWYPLASPQEEEPEIRASLTALVACLKTLPARSGVDAERTAVLGFSQGAVMAAGLITAPHAPTLAGHVLLSGYHHPAFRLPPTLNLTGRAVFVGHGSEDAVVPFAAGRDLAEQLRQHGATVSWHPYPMGHGIQDAELADVRAWLTRILP